MKICPKCKEKLEKIEKNYVCKNGHTYDIAKSGYVNLLLDNQKHSKNPGDDKDMVISRKRFLEKDYYKGISDKVNEVIFNKYQGGKINILDIGCGEGYYTHNIKSFLDEKNIENEIIGIDISKEAIISASKKDKNIDWVVASASNLPIKDNSLDFIICMFAKIIPEEKMRSLKKGGYLIIVSTGENHLEEMKKVVYKEVRKDFYSPIEDLKIFNYVETINCTYKTTINENESIRSMFNMTPYRWRSPREGIEKLFALDKLPITVDVNLDVFKKP